jgi:hypothetical protein
MIMAVMFGFKMRIYVFLLPKLVIRGMPLATAYRQNTAFIMGSRCLHKLTKEPSCDVARTLVQLPRGSAESDQLVPCKCLLHRQNAVAASSDRLPGYESPKGVGSWENMILLASLPPDAQPT